MDDSKWNCELTQHLCSKKHSSFENSILLIKTRLKQKYLSNISDHMQFMAASSLLRNRVSIGKWMAATTFVK